MSSKFSISLNVKQKQKNTKKKHDYTVCLNDCVRVCVHTLMTVFTVGQGPCFILSSVQYIVLSFFFFFFACQKLYSDVI